MAQPDVLKEFEKRIERGGHSTATLDLRTALDLLVEFYRSYRPDGCGESPDSDMLLYQWGTYDWGEGSQFEISVLRQFIFAGGADGIDGEDDDENDDENIWQLAVTFSYSPSEHFAAMGEGNRWNLFPSEMSADEFKAFVETSAPFQAACRRAPVKATVTYERAG